MKNNNKYIFYIISFLQGLVFYGAYSVVYREARGVNISQVFLLESIFLILMLLLEIPWGIVGDKIGYKKTLVISFAIYLVSKIVFYEAHSFFSFFMEAVLGAAAISGISGCDSAIIYLSVDKSESDKVFGAYGAFGAAGLFVSSIASGFMIEYSIDLLSFATIMSYGAVFLLSFMIVDVKKTESEKKEHILDSLKSSLRDRKMLLFIAAIAIVCETTHSICVFLNQPLYLKSGIDLKWFGMLLAMMQIAALLSAVAHKIKNKTGGRRIILLSLILISSCSFFLIMSRISYITVILIFVTEGAFAITQPISETIKNESIESSNRATVLSAYAMIGDIIAAVINIIIAAASDVSLEMAVIICLVLNIAAIILFLMTDKK